IFLVDPHVGLADSFLQAIDNLPPALRAEGIKRLRIITPDQPEVVPLNLLAIPEFTWAGNAIVQIGKRIWDDYWGPRMQAALLGLFRLAHTHNMHNPDERMGFLHVVFAAFDPDWRHEMMAYLDPVDRMGTLALDALLGQLSEKYGNWSQGWVTEVISPVLSKAMALELSPWLFASMHQNSFVDMEKWVKEKAWVVMRLPSGEMGREGARLTAGVVYNVFDAAFRRTTMYNPIPFYFIIDEAQEIGGGMRLEAMLSEGAKFGARMFVLVQSLSMMRRVEGFESVVQALLANTSTQAFFSPDPEDADLIRATLSSSVRYGDMTLDLPTLHAWLRARVSGRWQPPTVMKVQPIDSTDHSKTNAFIREVIAAHPEDYASPDGWQENTVEALKALLPPNRRGLLSELLTPQSISKAVSTPMVADTKKAKRRRLGL
ncbi:MAG: type IV secretory system conjugative DNA transfer family protein, partial [Chloroflexota bacterium]